jgi:DNA-binding CsgD family transcriptional regulator
MGPDGEVKMARDITITARELNPFEQLVLGLLCEGKTNSAIARETSHTEKVIENTISRAAKAFNIKSDADTNIRVLLALAFRTHFGDAAFDRLGVPCSHMEVGRRWPNDLQQGCSLTRSLILLGLALTCNSVEG